MHEATGATMNPRKKKLIRLDVQLRVVLIALCVASCVLLVNFQLSLGAVASAAKGLKNGTSARAAIEDLRISMINRFALSIGLTIPMAAVVGILYSFKFAGPIHGLSKYFNQLKLGPWNKRCSLRKGDDLQDLATAINDALDPLCRFLEENGAVLKELEGLLERGDLKPSGSAEGRTRALMERVAAAVEVCEARLPSSGRQARAAPAANEASTPGCGGTLRAGGTPGSATGVETERAAELSAQA